MRRRGCCKAWQWYSAVARQVGRRAHGQVDAVVERLRQARRVHVPAPARPPTCARAFHQAQRRRVCAVAVG